MLLYLHTMIFLKTRYIFTETSHIWEIVSHVYFLHIKFFIFTIAQIVPSASVPLQAWSAPLDQNESRSGEPCLLGCSLFSWVRVRGPYSTKKERKKKKRQIAASTSTCHNRQWARLGHQQTKPQASSCYGGLDNQGSVVTVWQGFVLRRQQWLPHTMLAHRSCSWRRLLLLLALNGRRCYRGGWRVVQYAHGKRVVRELHRSWAEKKGWSKKQFIYLIPRKHWLEQSWDEAIVFN